VTSSAPGGIARVIPRDDGRSWHVAAYLAGRNDLEAELTRQACSLDAVARRVGDAVAVSVLLARPRRSRVRIGGGPPRPWDGDSGDPASLLTFARDASRVTPDRALALVIGSHGDGWSVRPRATSLAADDRSGAAITTPLLGRVVRELHRARGRRLELLVLDACLMASVETLVEVADDVDVVVAPSTRTPRTGADHAGVVEALAIGHHSGAEVDRAVPVPLAAAAWLARWRAAGLDARLGPTTVSAFATQGVPELVAALDAFGARLAGARDGGDARAIDAARQDAVRTAPTRTDLGSLAARIGGARLRAPARHDLRAAARTVRAVLEPGGPLVLASDGDAGGGLTVTLPRTGRPVDHRPELLAAARISGWASFLDSLCREPAAPA